MAPDAYVLDVLGATVGVEFTGPARMHAESVMEPWLRCLAPRPVGPRYLQSSSCSDIPQIRLSSGNRPGVADRLSRLVTLRAIEQQRHRLLMFHAGAVSDGDSALALVAPSGGGKTTATRTLAAHYGYLSDETTAVDAEFRVIPYPKPLSVLQPAGQWKQQLSPDAAGLAEPTVSRPVLRHLLVLDRRADVDQPYLTRLDLADALTVLAPQISYLSALPQPLHRLAAVIEQCGGVLQVSYSEATDLVRVAGDLFATPPVETSAVDRASPDPVVQAGRRVPITDQLDLTDQPQPGSPVAVLADHRLLVLDGVGAAVWRAAGRSADPDAIVDAVVEELGKPPGEIDPAALVRDAVAELTGAGLLSAEGSS